MKDAVFSQHWCVRPSSSLLALENGPVCPEEPPAPLTNPDRKSPVPRARVANWLWEPWAATTGGKPRLWQPICHTGLTRRTQWCHDGARFHFLTQPDRGGLTWSRRLRSGLGCTTERERDEPDCWPVAHCELSGRRSRGAVVIEWSRPRRCGSLVFLVRAGQTCPSWPPRAWSVTNCWRAGLRPHYFHTFRGGSPPYTSSVENHGKGDAHSPSQLTTMANHTISRQRRPTRPHGALVEPSQTRRSFKHQAWNMHLWAGSATTAWYFCSWVAPLQSRVTSTAFRNHFSTDRPEDVTHSMLATTTAPPATEKRGERVTTRKGGEWWLSGGSTRMSPEKDGVAAKVTTWPRTGGEKELLRER